MMSLTKHVLAGAMALGVALPAFAGDIEVQDAYMRTSGAMAKSGAAFMQIVNTGTEDDRLIDAASDISMRVELHTHKASADGVMQMLHVPEGFVIPTGATHVLARGGDHVMFMGLTRAVAHGDVVNVTLTFEKAGEMTAEVPVDQEREDAPMPMDTDDKG